MSIPASKPKLPVAVEKPTPYTFDLGYLMAEDPNSITLDAAALEQSLASVARDGAQSLINQLLTVCAPHSTKDGVLLSLPAPSTRLPREKPVPQARPPTKWERFAAKKGITPKTREQRRNLTYDEATGEWTRKWGYKGANKKGEDEWLVEVDPEAEARRKDGTSVRADGRRERKERVRRNDRKMRKNARDAAEDAKLKK
ncbi:ribosome biogenesis protein [Cordyceps militaris CM01]|uniref:Ribosome biogenesis regulatory protein n=1 Tax=Cordyceps militaris (strain CM01) TaxID=983644 RepID=G3JKH8_CORMM|nr:ribosome biogenesis protein [Cordyceps militaris CM01]EGX91417.1 ribosome biogenesis protein [Cordyceps militaris CM01]